MRHVLKQLAAVVALGVVGVGSSALAGDTNEWAHCTLNADGSGNCNGNFLGFRNHPNPMVSAVFTHGSNGYRSFTAYFAPDAATPVRAYTCTPADWLAPLWDSAMSHRGNFSISWSASGICNFLFLANGSQYSQY